MGSEVIPKVGISSGIGLIVLSIYLGWTYVNNWFWPDYQKYLIFSIITMAIGFFIAVYSVNPKLIPAGIISGIFTYIYTLGIFYLTDIDRFYALLLLALLMVIGVYLYYKNYGGNDDA